MIDYNTYHKIIKNKKGEDITLVLNHVDNKNCKAYICKSKIDRGGNGGIKTGYHYVCFFPPLKSVTTSSMNWNRCGYFGMGAVEHSYSYPFNDFECVNIYNSGNKMKKNQTIFLHDISIDEIEIIEECEYIP